MRASTHESPAVPATMCPLPRMTGRLMFSGESDAPGNQAFQPDEEHVDELWAPLALVRQAS
jgi:hypothetical protein